MATERIKKLQSDLTSAFARIRDLEGTNLELASSLASTETEAKEAFSNSERDSQRLAISLAVENAVKAACANADAEKKEAVDSALSIASMGTNRGLRMPSICLMTIVKTRLMLFLVILSLKLWRRPHARLRLLRRSIFRVCVMSGRYSSWLILLLPICCFSSHQ